MWHNEQGRFWPHSTHSQEWGLALGLKISFKWAIFFNNRTSSFLIMIFLKQKNLWKLKYILKKCLKIKLQCLKKIDYSKQITGIALTMLIYFLAFCFQLKINEYWATWMLQSYVNNIFWSTKDPRIIFRSHRIFFYHGYKKTKHTGEKTIY